MTDEQKRYIEANIDLIEQSDWDQLFNVGPWITVGVGNVLYEAGIDFMAELGYVPDRAFEESNIKTIDIPDRVTSIGTNAFYACHELTSVTIGNGVTSIGSDAFGKCTSLESIVIPDNVTSIGRYAFTDCYSLKNVTIGNSVTSTGDGAFNKCTSLESVTIPDSVTSIDYGTFRYCSSLKRVEIPDSVRSIGSYAFYDCGELEINYNGTVAEWKNLIGSNGKIFYWSIYTCTCIDGVVKKSR